MKDLAFKRMEEKNIKKGNKNSEEELLWCEQFKEYISIKKGCQHPKGYCPYRKQCILYLSLKLKDF